MSTASLKVSDIAKEWLKDPELKAEYDALEDEFTLTAMTQEQVAAAMGTTQAAIARIESGRSLPSTRTLKRFADATGLKLRIGFER